MRELQAQGILSATEDAHLRRVWPQAGRSSPRAVYDRAPIRECEDPRITGVSRRVTRDPVAPLLEGHDSGTGRHLRAGNPG
jgi:hypothetical protein